MTDGQALPWDITPDDSWVSAVNTWPWEALGDGDWGKSANCPRCIHGIDITKETGYYAMLTFADPPDLGKLLMANRGPILAQKAEQQLLFARCNCGEAHTGRPPELKTGCGRSGYIGLPPAS